MKNKLLLIIAGAAIVTVSFTSVSTRGKKADKTVTKQTSNEPVGGFLVEDKL
ncbi:MAG TPA: hypothetical protein VIN08_21010 [Ohtaekwangia sp.]|uniref:hypothetical protein n=1 Tax=Ohtaekwangia sp. TaxID=2066019 RepID=UPI002F927D9E